MSVNQKMTAIANEVRTLSGTTEALGLDAMASDLNVANSNVSTEADLIAQINSALEGKAAGGGGGFNLDEYFEDRITEITSNVTAIPNHCVREKDAITKAHFPNATTIGTYAFASCDNMTDWYFPNVTSIGNYAFQYTPKGDADAPLAYADFPSLTSIGISIFSGANIRALVLRGNTIPSLAKWNHIENVQSRTYDTFYIYVPRAKIAEYESETNWAEWEGYYRAIEDYTVDGTITGALKISEM